jgi:hypothetical protein
MPRVPEHAMPRGGRLDDRLVAALTAVGREFADVGVRLGGEVHRWSIAPDAMSQRVIYRFPDYEETAAGSELYERLRRGRERASVVDGLVPAAELQGA